MALPAGHQRIATRASALAHVLLRLERYSEAQPLIEKALRILEATLGHDHPDVADLLEKLVTVQRHAGRIEDAEAPSRRALAILEKAFGLDDPLVIVSLRRYETYERILSASGVDASVIAARLAEAESTEPL